ncbi:MAG: hypothetical protein ACHQF2_05930, partial [Flavobacteriales bacterium]
LIVGLIGYVSYGNSSVNPKHRKASKDAIRRTAVVLRHAHKKVKENKVYTGNLLKAVRHQRAARTFWKAGRYGRALWHTRKSRQLAFLAIKANKGTVDKAWEVGKDENISGENQPTDEELEKELPVLNITEEELINAELEEIDLGAEE